MRLSDIMSQSGFAIYAEIALVLFLAVFVAVVVRIFWPARKAELDRASRLPLDDGTPRAQEPGPRRNGGEA
jgi:cbb3-type cytochrome oxidase subunit 3